MRRVAIIDMGCGCDLRSCYCFMFVFINMKSWLLSYILRIFLVLMQILTPGAEQLVIWSEACVNFLKDP